MTRYAKALVAFFTSLGAWGATALADNGLTAVEAFGLCGVIVATIAVWGVPNTPPDGEPADPAMSEQGHMNTALVTAVASVGMLIILLLWAFDAGPFAS